MVTHWDAVVDQTSIIFTVGCLFLSVLYGFGVLSIRLPDFSEIKLAEFETEVPQESYAIQVVEPKPRKNKKNKKSKKKKNNPIEDDCILALSSLGMKKTQAKKHVDDIFTNHDITSVEQFLGVLYANPK